MELVRGLTNLRPERRGCVLSIGNYDGVHRGHQALLARLMAHAKRTGLTPAVMIFEPTPREYFTPEQAPRRVLTLRDKLDALAGFGVQRVIIAQFDALLAGYSAKAFVEDIIVKACGAKAVVVGDDFRFGARRAGDFATLQQLGVQHGYVAEQVSTLVQDGERCSSTALRAALAATRFDRVQQLTGRRYVISGVVRHGKKLARELDMPTANLPLLKLPPLPFGVYAVRGTVPNTHVAHWAGVASLGVRPSIGTTPCLLEVHLFAPPENLYGKCLTTEFFRFIRPEKKFDTLDALKAQMHDDAMAAKTFFANANRDAAHITTDLSVLSRG